MKRYSTKKGVGDNCAGISQFEERTHEKKEKKKFKENPAPIFSIGPYR